MSLLAHHLHMMPSGTVVTRRLEQSNREQNQLLDQERGQEIAAAQQIVRDTGCSWSQAITSVARQARGAA